MNQKCFYQILDSTIGLLLLFEVCGIDIHVRDLYGLTVWGANIVPNHLWRFASKTAWWRDATFEVVLFPFIDKASQISVFVPWGGGLRLPVTLAQTLDEPSCAVGEWLVSLFRFYLEGVVHELELLSNDFVCLTWAGVEKINTCKWEGISCLTSLPL